MVFTSFTFLVFLVVVFSLYWLIPSRVLQNWLLVVSSYFFYAWWDYRFCALMFLASTVDYFIGLAIHVSTSQTRRKLFLSIAVVGQLLVLGYFKYFNFFAESFVQSAQSIGWNVQPFTVQVILPIGISFYTFQTLSYSIDIYRRQLEPTKRFVDFLAFVCFFPQLLAGPIERAVHLLPQFIQPRRFNRDLAIDGCRQALWGFFKKMAVADGLGVYVDLTYNNIANASGPQLALATVCFAFQIYCDFSGYSDIGIGVAKMFGFDLMQNFNYPYFSQSVAEFWRRWHISLTTWFRDYVFIPLGGSRVPPTRRSANVMAVFVLSGLWHGASWNFVIWGIINGVFSLTQSVGNRVRGLSVATADNAPSVPVNTPMRGRGDSLKLTDTPGGEGLWPSFPVLFRILGTFAVICAAWVFFRAASFNDALDIFRAMVFDAARLGAYKEAARTLLDTQWDTKLTIFLLLPVLIVVEWLRRRQPHPLHQLPGNRFVRWTLYTLMLWLCIAMARRTGTFIYFQF